MLSSPDCRELLSLFDAYKVRYLVVGAYAVMKYAEPRYTKDLNIWIATDEVNVKGVFKALKEFGAPLAGLSYRDFMDEESYYQMGREPMRLDVMMARI